MKKILVLDDETDVEFIFSAMLEEEIMGNKLQIDFFSNPQDCLDSFDQTPHKQYDHIFSDINMPQINGIEFVARLRQKGYQGPVSFISAYLKEDYETDMERLTVLLFLSKPLNFKDIREILDL